MSYEQEIAGVIYDQLGGKEFALMTGSKGFGTVKDQDKGLCLGFNVGSNGMGVTSCKIYLTPRDDYTVEFYKKGVRSSVVRGVYFDGLQEVFETATGMYTKFATNTNKGGRP